MKSENLNEVHTSTLVSFWQLITGFAFLPLLSLRELGGEGLDKLSIHTMSKQMVDGFQCFLGSNPTSSDDCSAAFWILIAYIVGLLLSLYLFIKLFCFPSLFSIVRLT